MLTRLDVICMWRIGLDLWLQIKLTKNNSRYHTDVQINIHPAMLIVTAKLWLSSNQKSKTTKCWALQQQDKSSLPRSTTDQQHEILTYSDSAQTMQQTCCPWQMTWPPHEGRNGVSKNLLPHNSGILNVVEMKMSHQSEY